MTFSPTRSAARQLVAAGAFAWLAVVPAWSLKAEQLDGLEKALRHRGLTGAQVGVLVVDRDSGAEVLGRGADRQLIAASNVKVLTALAALATFGPTHRFVTEIRADRRPDANGAVGKLVVVGGGDPSLTSEQMWRLAADLARGGLRRVDGDLVLDAGIFDDQLWNPTWGPTSARAYHAPVAGLSVNYGAFNVEVRPGSAAGAAPGVFVDPAVGYFTILNQAKTSSGAAANLVVDRSPTAAGDRVEIRGAIGRNATTRQVPRSVTRPVEYAGQVFAKQLAASGIESGPMRIGTASPQDVSLYQFDGKTVAEDLQLLMKYSNNNIAESLVKSMGRHSGGTGSWAAGVAAMRATLIGLGVAPESFSLVDGSGLSRQDRVTPRALVTALRIASTSFLYGPEFVSALPIANRDGTLGKRARGSRDAVRAKTGLLTGATGLSGIARGQSGRHYLFSIIANDYKEGDLEAMAALDAFIAALSAL